MFLLQGFSVKRETKAYSPAFSPDTAQQSGVTAAQGVIVVNVAQGSAAGDAGVMRGDVIHEMNGTNITGVKDFNAAAAKVQKNREIVLLIERGDSMIYLAFVVR